MPSDTPPGPRPFTVFRSAAEEAATKLAGDRETRPRTRVVHVPGGALPYHAVVTRKSGRALERAFATMREAETFIRGNSSGATPRLSTLYDRPPPKT